ncbi:MAG TPA: hypothetical protein VLB80_02480 [Candidatus Babeliales bacterium]|nr:hypothetical protein [Candidatus Babeliales bacterium]
MLMRSIIVLGLCSSALFGMNPKLAQLEICGDLRKKYVSETIVNKPTISVCHFCDKDILAANFIIYEDHKKDMRVMTNKNPYFDFEQGDHLLFMTISHEENPANLSREQLIHQTDAVQQFSADLYEDAYTQEYFTNWGKIAGQSVPHWHSQFKNYVKPPQSLPEQMKARQNYTIKNGKEAYEVLKNLLYSKKNIQTSSGTVIPCDTTECTCCSVKDTPVKDNDNFVIERFDYNYVCLSHHPSTAGEISVVPNQHVSAIKDLSPDVLRENMILATALLPIMQKYAQENIRECGGGNLYTKSMGGKASIDVKAKYHVHTVVIPRTTIQPTPGTIDGNSAKLDVDPIELANYLKKHVDELKDKLI